MARLFRVYARSIPDRVQASDIVTLDPGESHHVCRVLRLREGDEVRVFDGVAREWLGQVVAARPQASTIRIERDEVPRAEPSPSIVLYQGLCRHERMEWLLQKATEVGVSGFVPIRTERTDVRPPSTSRRERWDRILVEACKQSGRVRIPQLAEASSFPVPAGSGHDLLLDPEAGERPLAAYLAGHDPGPVRLAVGPESGFSPDETASAESTGWSRVGLGPRVLRTETAGLIAAALILGAWGDLGQTPRV